MAVYRLIPARPHSDPPFLRLFTCDEHDKALELRAVMAKSDGPICLWKDDRLVDETS